MSAITEPTSSNDEAPGAAAGSPSSTEKERQRRVRHWLNELAGPARPQIRLAIFGGTASAIAMVVQLGLTAWLVSQVVMKHVELVTLTPLIGGILAAILLRGAFQIMRDNAAAASSETIRQSVRRQLIESWQAQGPAGLARTSPATLASEWLEQVEALHGYFARFLPQMMLSVIVPLLILVVVFCYDGLAALFLLLSAPLIPLFMALVGMGAEKLNQQHFETLGRLSGHFMDRLRGLTTLQLFGQTDKATREVGQVTDQFRKVNMKTLKVAFLSSAVLEFFSSVAIAVIAMYIGFGLLGYIHFGGADELTLFSGLFILLLAPEFFQPLRLLSQHYHDRASAIGAADCLLERLEAESARSPTAPAVYDTPDTAQGIHLKHVSFGFADRGPLFADLSLTIGAGEIVGLEGPSGCGKSTLLHLIAGFCLPQSGSISVFGETPGARPFGWLGQSPFILQGTWAQNLRLVAPDASDEQLLDALAKAGLTHLVETHPQRLNAPVSESGAGLSGGQARRLALARIFLADYPLVLLDEPTAGLDAESEEQVIAALDELVANGRTLVLASHHPQLLDMADTVYRVRHGGLIHE
ncbi:thiol reductant ABC exporter subunit CydD [Marinobacter halodurans]|uniref:thiol reductant ABC exporter subunit CydD n=1 Tax=Marinobacter halodurans TaxID=2528979 RepID=UPI001F61A3C0|nr:thiol reductant ABC exporter subunit CydD [Marinobacter halodurans]